MSNSNILLVIMLVVLLLFSVFFSASETAMMAINRYRLRHLERKKHKGANRISKLLEHPDRLLGVILLGSTFANIVASSVVTILAHEFGGNLIIAGATIGLTFFVLIFCEVAPKTVAANDSFRVAMACSWLLSVLLKLLYPFVWIINLLANGFLKLFRYKEKVTSIEHLTSDELSTIVKEAGAKIPDTHQDMLLGVLSLEKVAVDDIMVPRSDIIGIDVEEEWSNILRKLTQSQHTRLPLYKEDINNVKGILHMRLALNLMSKGELTKKTLLEVAESPYFIPEGASLNNLLLHFRAAKQRMGLVVDEYGDVVGLITMEDILEEIVGEFTTNMATFKALSPQPDGSYLVEGGVNLRDLNRIMHWNFDTSGPKTLSGAIVEYLETMPHSGICLRLSGYPLEILEVAENTIKSVRIYPEKRPEIEE